MQSRESVARRNVELVMPDLFDRSGGIARVGRTSTMALAAICETYGLRLSAHVLHDRGATRDRRYLPDAAEYHAYASSRVNLTRGIVRGTLDPAHLLTIFFHVHLAATMLLSPKRPRYVVVGHGFEVWHRLPWHRRRALQQATEVWAVSDYSAQQLVAENGVDRQRVRVVPNALDPYLESYIEADGGGDGQPFILAVSRLSRDDIYKGIDLLLRSFARIASDFSAVRLIIVGEGNDLDRLRAFVRSAAIEERVEFQTCATDADLALLYQRCTLFALPSKKEGFGLVFLEAMRAGKPVIAAAAGGATEVVDDGRSGILVPPDDADALSSALRHLLADSSLAQSMGSEGRRRAIEQFGYRAYTERIADALGSLCDLSCGSQSRHASSL